MNRTLRSSSMREPDAPQLSVIQVPSSRPMLSCATHDDPTNGEGEGEGEEAEEEAEEEADIDSGVREGVREGREGVRQGNAGDRGREDDARRTATLARAEPGAMVKGREWVAAWVVSRCDVASVT